MALWSAYKSDQGRWVRYFALISVIVLTLWAAGNLYQLIVPAEIPHADRWFEVEFMGLSLVVSWHMIPPAILFLLVGTFAWKLSQRQRVADFLIETEGELKKVSWPARKEWTSSSVAVIVTILVFVAYLYLVDLGLSAFFTYLKIGF